MSSSGAAARHGSECRATRTIRTYVRDRSRPISRGVIEFAAVSVAAASGAVVYAATVPLWAPPLAALATWGLLRVAVVRPMVKAMARDALVEGDDLDYDETIAELRASTEKILQLSSNARDPLVRERGGQIVDALNRVIRHLVEDPDDVISSRRFLAVYVERTKGILQKYIQYEALQTPQAQLVRVKVRDELLPLLVTLCEQQLYRITYDDIRSFETDIDVLKKAIQLEEL